MAEPTFQPGALPIVSGLAQIEQIKGAREARGLAQQSFDLLQQQTKIENMRQTERIRIEQEDREMNRLEKNLVLADKLGDFQAFDDTLSSLNKMAGTNIRGDRAQIAKTIRLRAEAERKGDTEEVEFYDEQLLKFNITAPEAGLARIGRPEEAAIEKGRRLKREQRVERGELFKEEEERERIRFRREFEGKGEELERAQKIVEEQRTEKEARIRELLKDADVKPELAEAIVGVSLGDISPVGFQRAFPTPPKDATTQKRSQAIKVLTDQLNQLDINEEFVLKGDKRTKVESQRDRLIGQMLKELGLEDERSPEGAGAAKELNFKTPTELFKSLEQFGEFGDLNPGSYISSVLADDRNKDAQGKLKASDSQIVQGYIEALHIAKGSPPTFLGGMPKLPAGPEITREAEEKPQKAILGR